MGNYKSEFSVVATELIAEGMRELVMRLLRQLDQNTPVESDHGRSGWKFCIGTPPTNDDKATGRDIVSYSKGAIAMWDGIQEAHVYNNARDGEYMYLIKVNALTARGGAGPLFIQKSIENALNGN